MTLDGQRVQPGRYTVVPRTLSFLIQDDRILLLRIREGRNAWSGLLNGVGGHIEQGESPGEAARREILEETGLVADQLQLCGVVLVDVGSKPGIALTIFVGGASEGKLTASAEGVPEWIPLSQLKEQALVQDLHELIPRALDCHARKTTFTALTMFDQDGSPRIRFSP